MKFADNDDIKLQECGLEIERNGCGVERGKNTWLKLETLSCLNRKIGGKTRLKVKQLQRQIALVLT